MDYIYKIINTKTGKFYVGRTNNLEKRISRHFKELEKGKHHSIHLQRSYNKHGRAAFIVESNPSTNAQMEEQEYLDTLLLTDGSILYNVSGASTGGDMIKNHPDKKAIIEKRRLTQIEQRAQMTEEERKQKFGNSGSANGRYVDGRSVSFCNVCNKKVTGGASHCIEHKEHYNRSCANNPFFGKSHSDETKKKLSEQRLGVPNVKCMVKYKINGVIYNSGKEAAEHFGVSRGTITHRTKSPNYPEYEYA